MTERKDPDERVRRIAREEIRAWSVSQVGYDPAQPGGALLPRVALEWVARQMRLEELRAESRRARLGNLQMGLIGLIIGGIGTIVSVFWNFIKKMIGP